MLSATIYIRYSALMSPCAARLDADMLIILLSPYYLFIAAACLAVISPPTRRHTLADAIAYAYAACCFIRRPRCYALHAAMPLLFFDVSLMLLPCADIAFAMMPYGFYCRRLMMPACSRRFFFSPRCRRHIAAAYFRAAIDAAATTVVTWHTMVAG